MTEATELDAYRWLISPPAQAWLKRAAEDPRPLLNLTASLRTQLSAEQTHVLLQQVDLRRRAREKFTAAERMFFTRKGLEQATGERVAAYKARRFPAGERTADLCCGIGGDLCALRRQSNALGIDRSPVAALLAEANCAAQGLADNHGIAVVRAADVVEIDLGEIAAWHIDPDRRPAGRRTIQLESHEPGPAVIESLLVRNPNAAIKLAPAAMLPDTWTDNAELEWISRGGECRQLVVWFGGLARDPGRRKATVVASSPSGERTLVGQPDLEVPITARVGRYLFEPDAAVLAAKLVGVLVEEFNLAALIPGGGYLTGDRPILDPAMAAFEVSDVLPFDLKTLKAILRQRRIGLLEIKKRGVPYDPAKLRQQLAVAGDQSATLLVTRIQGKVTAILGRRLT